MTEAILLGMIGVIGVLVGAEVTIRGSKNLARKFGISEYVIGLTILSIGTSLPEIFTHIVSSIDIWYNPLKIVDLSGVSVGTNIGSNIIQSTLITGFIGLIAVVKTTEGFLKKDYMMLLAATFLVWLFALNNNFSRGEGLFLVLTYCYYTYWLLTHDRKEYKELKKHEPHSPLWDVKKSSFALLFGLTLLIFCANFVLDSAIYFTDVFSISGSLIGVVVIGLCTALPELMTAISGIRQKSSGLSLGTLIGSNITNPMLALGLGALISRYELDFAIVYIDIPYLFVVSLIGLWFFWTDLTLKKWEAVILVAFYFLFLGFRFLI